MAGSTTTLVRVLLTVALIAGAVIALPSRAAAAFHLMSIVEVFPGTSEHPTAQFVELQMYERQQNFVQMHDLFVYDASGDEVGSFRFAAPVPNGSNQSSILIATSAAETFFGVNANLQMMPVIPAGGGKVCWEDVDCVSWGSYSAGSGSTGTPFNKPDGLVVGAAIRRDISGGNNEERLEASDDTDDSDADFLFGIPEPRNNAGATGRAPGGGIEFEMAEYTVGESDGTATITVVRSGGSGEVSTSYSTRAKSATEGEDFSSASGVLQFADGETTASFEVTVLADNEPEDDETVELRLRDTTGDAALGLPNAKLTITDDDAGGDTTAPESKIRKPAQGETYKAGKLEKLKGTATDDGSGVESVEVALRKKKKNGNCAWFDGSGFSKGGCSKKMWLEADGSDAWTYALGTKLGSSKGTKTKNYTAYARAADAGGNVEDSFDRGRNKNTFEIK